ncbi:cytochrome P450 [Halorientalis regularis]|jgi:cytochrome P450|uniref:Cytochrome P450 n=1 Tax=Halorientalis regularis TaxID=660518 RepID=A0A1G7JB96_9EURY|nr:cytochrome P450 [Halorientalis regularis]SDF22168.1 Cytochrome P450 [Halorientalis regularis]
MSDRVHTPPGPPVVGNVPKLTDDPLRFFVALQEAYGGRYPLVRLDPPVGQSFVVVLDAELVHEILGDRDRFARPALGPQERRRQGLLSSDGVLWEQQRSVLQPEFVGGKLAEYADITADTVSETIDGWPAEGRLDLHEELSTLTMRVITRSLFSRDTDPEQARAVHEALGQLSDEVEPSATDVLLPDALQSGPSETFEEADAVIEGVASEFVEWHRDQSDPPADMITALMDAQADPDVALSENELVDEAVLFLTGGQETTALTITYAFYWLSKHPAMRDRVAAEAAAVLDGGEPTWADLSDLTYTERVVRETLRLTPAVWNVTREVRQPTTLAGTELDAEDLLFMSTYAHHRDSRVWADPLAFRPDRWDGEVSRSEDAYFPFGSGPRICIGQQIALTEAQFTLAHVLQHYDVTVEADELALQPSVTLRPTEPVHATVTERSAPVSE